MNSFKRLLPSSLKDVGKQCINTLLRPFGWRLAPADSTVLEGAWFDSPIDGLVSQHEPASLRDNEFQQSLKHLASFDAFEGLDAAVRGETFMQRLYIASQLATVSSHLPGSIIEFGTYRGATAYCMLKATQRSSDNKRVFLYDTFSGIPSSGMTEYEREVGLAGKHTGTSTERVAEMLAEFSERVQFREGLIPDTLDETGPTEIALMHVDLNLSAPTLAALQWAMPKWVRGGICLLDDYLWKGFEDQRQVVEQFFGQQNLTIVGLPTGQGLVLNYPPAKPLAETGSVG